MNVESLLVSKDRDRFNKLISFLRSLIIKNEVEGEQLETTDIATAYSRYELAYLGVDSSLSYIFSLEDLIDFGFTELVAEKYYYDPRTFQSAVMRGDTQCKAFLSKMRKERIQGYIENNPYYRQFCGLPYDETQYIEIDNLDSGGKMYLHEVDSVKHQTTYSKLFYEREIDQIYQKYDFMYLTFLESPMDPYEIRHKGQFEICYYDKSLLDTTELAYWFEAYTQARTEIMLSDYIEAFQNNYKSYVNLMYMFILSYAVNIYNCKTLEKYAVRDYTDAEVYDILESNGLGNLKKLNISLLRRVVQKLPDLKAYTGSNSVIDILFDIVADNSLSVKRYYLNKKYNTDNEGNTEINSDKMYDKSVDLVFLEKTTNKGSDVTSSLDVEYNYEDIVMSDDTWGGTKGLSETEKAKVKEDMRKELLSHDFTTIMTKYIGLSKIVDMTFKLVEVNNKLGLYFQLCDFKGNSMGQDSIQFDGIEVNPLVIYAAWCFVFGTLNGLSDPDYIISDATTLEGLMKLRSSGDLISDANELSEVYIDLGNGYTRQLKHYLSAEEIREYLVKFNYDENTDIQSLFNEYDKNYAILEKIKDKIANSYDYDEYKVWETIYKANITHQTISNLFGGNESYSQYIENASTDFYNHFITLIDSVGTTSKLYELCEQLYRSFDKYLKEQHEDLIYVISEDDVSGGEDLSEISVLFNQFMSVYTQLYKQDFHISYDDDNEHALVLLMTMCANIFKSKGEDGLILIDRKTKDVLKTTGKYDDLELLYYITDVIKSLTEIDIELNDEIIRNIFISAGAEHLLCEYEKTKDELHESAYEKMTLDFEKIYDSFYEEK